MRTGKRRRGTKKEDPRKTDLVSEATRDIIEENCLPTIAYLVEKKTGRKCGVKEKRTKERMVSGNGNEEERERERGEEEN